MGNNNGRPKVTRKQIQKLIDGFEEQLPAAQAELERADTALSAAKLAQIEEQKQEVPPGNDVLPRAQFFVLEESEEFKHLRYMRERAVGQLGDIQRRLKLLKRALSMTPE